MQMNEMSLCAQALAETLFEDRRTSWKIFTGWEKSPWDGKSLKQWFDPKRFDRVVTRAAGSSVSQDEIALACEVLRAFTSNHMWIGSDPEGILTLLPLCVQVARNPQTLGEIVFTIGFGGSEDRPSLRTPAYVMPVVKTVQSLLNLGLPAPQIRVFCAQYAAVLANRKDEKKLWPNTMLLFFLISSFLREFYPKIAPLVVYDVDRPYSTDLVKYASMLGKELVENSPGEVRQAVKIAREWGFVHGGEEGKRNAPLYGALHPIMFRFVGIDGLPASAWIERTNGSVRAVISSGGPPELQFLFIERWLANRTAVMNTAAGRTIFETTPFVPFITPVGNLPVYYRPKVARDIMADMGEIRDFLEAEDPMNSWRVATKDSRVSQDFETLFQCIARKGEDRSGTLLKFLEWASNVLGPLEYVREENGVFSFQLAAAKLIAGTMDMDAEMAAFEVADMTEGEKISCWQEICESFFGLVPSKEPTV